MVCWPHHRVYILIILSYLLKFSGDHIVFPPLYIYEHDPMIICQTPSLWSNMIIWLPPDPPSADHVIYKWPLKCCNYYDVVFDWIRNSNWTILGLSWKKHLSSIVIENLKKIFVLLYNNSSIPFSGKFKQMYYIKQCFYGSNLKKKLVQ